VFFLKAVVYKNPYLCYNRDDFEVKNAIIKEIKC